MKTKSLILIFISFLLFSCKGEKKESQSSQNEYPDGIYCAEIEYYYKKAGTHSTYALSIEVENDKLIKIYWPNGGWLDDTHFTPPDISSGSASFTTYEGREYGIRIMEEGECDSYYVQEKKKQDEICPKCGDEKDSWDEYCSDCEDEIENTCSRCGGYEYNVQGGVCSSCEDDDNEEE